MSDTPIVSVIMPAHNAEPYISRAIDSVLGQTLADLELVIVDDVSSDGTGDVARGRAAGDARIRYIRRDRNGGPGVARNTAIEASRGEWIAMLDADDWYEPARLEKLIQAANRDGVPMAADNQGFVQAADGTWDQTLVETRGTPIRRLNADELLRGDRLQRTSRNLGLLKPVVRRDFLAAHDITYDSEITLGEDFYFLLKCLRYTPHMVLVTEPLYNYSVYLPLAQTKNQTLDGYRSLRTLHGRYMTLFDPLTAPSTATLMEQRRNEIERYIRFKQLAEPLKRGRFGGFLKQARRDPAGLLLLMQRALADPRGGLTHLYELARRRPRLAAIRAGETQNSETGR